jgi:5-methylcytosine-specific restriction endonuclease McrA
MPSKKTIDTVWEKAKPIRGKNPDAWRRDSEGQKIRRGSYGTQGKFGWDVDHKNPKSRGGSDNPRNLQPLHWKENREKGDRRQPSTLPGRGSGRSYFRAYARCTSSI